jgi:signal transduction histidine kinase
MTDLVPPVAEALVQCVDRGVVVLADDVVVAVNRGFLDLFDQAARVGESVPALAAREPAAAELWAGRLGGYGRRRRCTLPDDRVVEVRWTELPSDGPRLLAAVVGDLTGEAEVRHRLRQHNRALAEVVATKTELVSALLHELRTPLTAALTMAEMLPEQSADPLLDEALPMIVRKLRRIDEVVREIATISGIEGGKVPLEHQEFDLPALVGEVAAEAGLRIVARPVSGTVTGDRRQLGQVFRRLVAAVRAVGGDDDEVTVELTGDRWRTALRLPSRQATDRLFTTAESGGNATALMLARAIVGRHGGGVGVDSVDGVPHLTVWLPA